MSPVRSPHTDPSRPSLRQRVADLAGDLARATVSPKPTAPASTPPALPPAAETSPVFERIAASTRDAAADALADERVSPALRAAIEAHRDATLAMLLCHDTSNEASEPLCEAVEASGEALCAVPARTLADVRAKLAFLLPEILPDVNGATPTAFLESVFDDVERLVDPGDEAPDPIHAAIAASRRVEAGAAVLDEGHADDLADAQSEAKDAAYAIVPTTRAGRLALAEFAAFHLSLTIGPNWRAEAARDFYGEPFLALANAIMAEGDAPPLDLSGVSIRHLARFYDHLQGLAHIASMAVNAPMAWDDRRRNHSPLGPILEDEADRLDQMAGRVAAEIRVRTPGSDSDRDDRLATLVKRELSLDPGFDEVGLVAEVTTVWGR